MEKELKDMIASNESNNRGKTIFLYYNGDVGFYTAYGFSAFLVSHVVEPVCSFSSGMQMPVALLSRWQINELRRSLLKVRHVEHSFYEFELRREVGAAGYEKWMNALKQ